jgi:hypothetical protein
MRSVRRIGLFLALFLAGARGAAVAQVAGSIAARATVLTALSVTGSADLAFGTVASTQTKTVAPAAGGRFMVDGPGNGSVLVSFTLPAALGANVNLGGWTGLSNKVNVTGTANPLTVSGAGQSVTLSASGRLFVWVGATLSTVGALGGSYSAPVQMTVVYN